MTGITPAGLARLGAGAAILGGSLRIALGLIPFQPGTAWLEAVYALIDFCLLTGLTGLYLTRAAALGHLGLGFALIAGLGLASLVGPDATRFGIDFYALGSAVTALGLAGLAIQGLRVGAWRWASGVWLLTPGLGTVAMISGSALSWQLAGLAFGLGFVLAGLQALREAGRARDIRP
tara:strand:- start:1898 stop:2428 length:531 start_codon:yes stop_codon:yes gene_type:complete